MARTRYVHRTILSTEAEVMTIDLKTKETASVVIAVQGKYEDPTDAKLEKEVKKCFDKLGRTDKFVAITDVHVVTKEYKMLESQFMTLAESKIVDGTGAENDEDEEEDDEEEA